jgi:hypothetical protein
MTDHDRPSLSPNLIAKLKAMDIQSIADIVSSFEAESARSRLPAGVARITADQADYVADVETREQPEPIWPVEPVADRDDEIYAFYVRSSLRHYGQFYTFFTTADFKNLAVPLLLLSPFDHMPDPILKRWHWWRGDGVDSLGTIQAAQVLAKRIVCGFEGVRYEDANPKTLAKKFDIVTPKAAHTFMSWGDWTGLWVPTYMLPESPPDDRAAMFVKLFKETEISGETAIKRHARKLAKRYDKIVVKPRMPAIGGGPYKGMYIPLEHQRRWEQIQRWMAAGRPDGCSFSKVMQNLIDDQYDRMPPEGDWPIHPYVSVNMISPEPSLLRPEEKRQLSARQREVLEAARRLFVPGKPATPKAIAKVAGITPNHVSLTIRVLRNKGLWPYPSPQPGRKDPMDAVPRVATPRDEEIAAEDIVARLMRLPNPESRRRALDLVESARAPDEDD